MVVLRQVLLDLKRNRLEFGDHHPKVAETYTSLGLIRLHMQQDAFLAQQCFQQALSIFQRENNPLKVAVTLQDMALCYEKLEAIESALELYTEAVRILGDEARLPQHHPRMIAAQRSLCRLLRR